MRLLSQESKLFRENNFYVFYVQSVIFFCFFVFVFYFWSFFCFVFSCQEFLAPREHLRKNKFILQVFVQGPRQTFESYTDTRIRTLTSRRLDSKGRIWWPKLPTAVYYKTWWNQCPTEIWGTVNEPEVVVWLRQRIQVGGNLENLCRMRGTFRGENTSRGGTSMNSTLH